MFDGVPGVTTFGCWAHARRNFFEAREEVAAKTSAHVVSEIGRLYETERRLSEQGATNEERLKVRQEAWPVLSGLKAFLEEQRALPRSAWGKAVAHALARWEKLARYAEDGAVEIDNNLYGDVISPENTIRPVALGRKNYPFAGSHEATERAAVVYSLLSTCKRHEVNAQEWLTDVLARIPTHPARQVEDLLPHRWKSNR